MASWAAHFVWSEHGSWWRNGTNGCFYKVLRDLKKVISEIKNVVDDLLCICFFVEVSSFNSCVYWYSGCAVCSQPPRWVPKH